MEPQIQYTERQHTFGPSETYPLGAPNDGTLLDQEFDRLYDGMGKLQTQANGLLPLGAIIAAAHGSHIPSSGNVVNGWMRANGDVAPPGYALEGWTTPNLSDDRFLMGSTNPGTTGGANTKTLSTGEMPSHNHTASSGDAGSHDHTATSANGGSHAHTASSANGGSHDHAASSGNAGNHTHTASTGNAGGGSVTVSIASSGNHDHGLSIDTGGRHRHTSGGYYTDHSTDYWSGEGVAVGHNRTTGGSEGTYDLFAPYTSYSLEHSHYITSSKDGSHTHSGTASLLNHTHTVTVESNATHAHSITVDSDGSHNHTVTVAANGAHNHSVTVNTNGTHSHSVTVGNTGSGTSWDSRPKFLSVVYLVKVD